MDLVRAVRRAVVDRNVIACGVLALLVLLPGWHWGIPYASSIVTIRGWDVDGIAGIGVLSELHNLTVAARDDWYVAYPLFHYLVLAVASGPYLAYLLATGGLSAPSGQYPFGFADPIGALATLNAIGHGVSVLMGCGVVLAVFTLARRLFGTAAAWVAAALALCSAPFVFYSRTGNLDVPVLFWIMWAFVAIERAWTDGLTVRRAVVCAALASCAVATKDQAYGLLVPPLAALVVQHLWRTVRTSATAASQWKPVAALMASGVVSFLVAGGIVVRPDRFLRHLQYISNFEETFANVRTPTDLTVLRAPTALGSLQLSGDFMQALGTAAGWPVLIVGLLGFVLAWRQASTLRWLLAATVGFAVLVILPVHHMQYRYALAPACIIAIAAAGALARLEQRGRIGRLLARGGAVLLIGSAALGAAEMTHAMLVDSRWEATRWIATRVAAPDTVGFFGRPHQLPYIPAGVHVEMMGVTADAAADLSRVNPRWIVVAPDYFADASRERSVFLPAQLYSALQNGSLGWTRVARFASPSLLGRPLPYLPYVNPPVQLFERRAGAVSGGVSGGVSLAEDDAVVAVRR